MDSERRFGPSEIRRAFSATGRAVGSDPIEALLVARGYIPRPRDPHYSIEAVLGVDRDYLTGLGMGWWGIVDERLAAPASRRRWLEGVEDGRFAAQELLRRRAA